MNGAESLVRSLIASGIDTCFANPGTSEMHFVAALDRIPGIRCVLGLQENVVTGMADGYWRMQEKPAATLLHCGPGLANGLANLHNARRARSGIVNIVGDQATYHRIFDAPLTADTPGLARAVSAWVQTAASAGEVGKLAAMAVQAARMPPGQVASLILPADTAWNEGGQVADALPVQAALHPDPAAVRQAARIVREKSNVLILLGGKALRARGQQLAWRVAANFNHRILGEGSNARMERGLGTPMLERVPYAVDAALETFKSVEHLILVNARVPVGFFAYPGKPSSPVAPQTQVHELARLEEDGIAALQALIDELHAPPVDARDPGSRPEVPAGKSTSEGFARTLAACMPEHAIVADESVSFGRSFFRETHAAPLHDWIQITGGAIGCGMPLATGAALGGGGRRVINLQADGSAMYTLQSLWTQAREKLPVTTIIFANRKYAILLGEYKGVGAEPGPTAMDMLDLSKPDLAWVQLANGMGVDAAQATSLKACADLMQQSFQRQAPFLIELVL